MNTQYDFFSPKDKSIKTNCLIIFNILKFKDYNFSTNFFQEITKGLKINYYQKLDNLIIEFENMEDSAKIKDLIQNKDFSEFQMDHKIIVLFTVKKESKITEDQLSLYEDVNETNDIEIPGLIIEEDFISKEEEEELINYIEKEKWNTFKKIKRRVQHYGYEFDYDTNNIDVTKKMGTLPKYYDSMIKKIKDYISYDEPDQLTINEYEPGQGIKPHIVILNY
jgi:succinate dehydrogenase flavin-adding protein (antitoxin of CptAB toxin-antitoxin module)